MVGSLAARVCLALLSAELAAQQQPYRFDDRFASTATVNAPPAAGTLRLADPVMWDFNGQALTWTAARGRVGFKPGQLIIQGQGSTPVLVAPTNPPIDWSRYDSIVIRMIAEGGSEIKIKLGEQEFKQKLGAPLQWQDYRFSLKSEQASFTRPLAIMPTDDVNATAAIDSIALVPRESPFNRPAGVANVGKREEYRNVLFARAPSSITYDAPIPAGGVLHFGLGVSSASPVTFKVLIGAAAKEIFAVTMRDPNVWQDMVVDVSQHAGASQRIVFRTESAARDAVGFWANPLLMGQAPPKRPNVMLYVVCTLRPDHTSLYGYSRETTPFLKTLGASSVVFEDAFAQAPWTKPSVASLMTSLHAYTHGLVNDTDTIPPGAATLAEQLRKSGYTTASIVANPFAGRTSGLQRGFDYMMEYPVVQRHRTDRVDRGTDSAAINRAIMPWLDEHAAEPFFLYVQSTDPHAPYRPPAEFEAKFANPLETPLVDSLYAKLRDIRAYGGGATVTREEMRGQGIDPATFIKQAVDRYDAEIANNDRNIELLTDRLKKLGLFDKTVIVIASDHGEEFWEHGFGAHGHSLYSELIRTVLMIRNPAQPAPRRVTEPVQLIDIMPTILELTATTSTARMQGQSLAPLLRGQPFRRTNPILSTKLALPRAKPGGGVPENLTDTIAWIDGNTKMIYRTQAARAGLKEVELYDRRADPGDRMDVAGQRKAAAEKLKLEVVRWLETQNQIRKQLGPAGQSRIDTQNLERLRSLGYLGGKQPQ